MTNRIPLVEHLGLRVACGALRPKPRFTSRRLQRNSLAALLALGGLLASGAAEAQQCPPGKSCYYIPPILQVPVIAPQNYGGDLVFYAIGSDVSGTYSFNGGADVPFTALAGTPLTVPFAGTEGIISGYLVPESRGAFVVADSPSLIVEQRVTAASWQASATMKNQLVGLGTRFRAGSYPLNTPNADDTGFDFLSFYAPTATNVTVTAPPGAAAPFWNDGIAGLTHTFSLNGGQTYTLRTQLGVDFDGALITSTQPISVTVGGRGWFSGCGDEGRDHLVPTNLLGTQFVVDDYPSILSETLRVVADSDNTQVSVNGAVVATINAGRFYEPALSGVTFIETSQPAYVFQNAGLVQCELDIAMIPPLVLAPLASSSISVNVLGTGHAVMFIPTAAVSSVLLDGVAPPSPQISPVPTHPEYSRVRFDVSGTNHIVSAASDFQIGVVSFAPGATGLFAYFNPYRLSTCGNGLLNSGEGCDDGNFDEGDGCNSNCEVEANYVCTGEPSVCVLDPCLGVVCEPLDDCHDAGECDSGTGQCSNPEKVNGSACDDGDACTQLDSCLAGVCASGTPVTCTAQDQCHDAGTCNSTTGVCSNPSKPDGATCNDGDACTQTDACQAGACNGGNPVTCTALDQCHDAGTCDSATGVCSNPNKADGTTCNDGNACTQTDSCQAGTCAGANPVTCTALDQCHDAGTCDSATGVCSNPNKADGTTCNDGDACTQTDSCQAGTCASGNPVTCTAQDQCHDAGTCDSATGTCSNPNKPDGTNCNDGNACTQTDACVAGACNGANPITCTAQDQCHDAGTCDPATGTCSNPNKPDGTNCNDGNACTQTDACLAGTCNGANPITCTAQDQCHDAGTCNPATGACSSPAKPDGTTCNDGNACTQTDACQGGTCNGANPVTCTAQDQCHDAGTCDPATGACSNPNKPDGTNCNDGNACTQTDACQAGACNGANPITCTAQDQCHDAGTCDPATGTCSNPNKPDGTTCNDGNACTQTDSCQAGTCSGGDPVTCSAQDQCHDAGTCNPATGTCSNPNKPNGTTCNDGNACTQTDACQAGACNGANPITCTAQDQCHDAGTCNPATGTCSNPNKADGTTCNDGNACTQTDTCQAGACNGANPVTCAAQDQCHDAGTCNPATGTCSNPAKPDGTNCNDNNACTQTDACQAGACNGANPVTCTAQDQCHAAGACDPATGTCTNPSKPDGASCNDGNSCTKTDICTVGTCGGTTFTCTPSVCQVSSTCDGNGGCVVVNQPAGTPCPDDGNACTIEACDGAGKCAQTLAPNGSPCETGKVCNGGMCTTACFIDGTLYVPNAQNAQNRCQICNPSVSTTAWSNANDGTICDNGDGCTKDDVCQAGQCVGTPVTCMPMDQCHDAGTCDSATGACTNPPKADGTACNDNSACTVNDVCTAGVCNGGIPNECIPTDECHDVGVCDPVTGECSNPEKPDGTECSGGACQQGVCEPGSSSSSGVGGAGGAGGAAGAGGEGGGGEGGGSSGDEPLVGRGGACLCTTADNRTSPQGFFAFLGMALLSLTRRAKRSKQRD